MEVQSLVLPTETFVINCFPPQSEVGLSWQCVYAGVKQPFHGPSWQVVNIGLPCSICLLHLGEFQKMALFNQTAYMINSFLSILNQHLRFCILFNFIHK